MFAKYSLLVTFCVDGDQAPAAAPLQAGPVPREHNSDTEMRAGHHQPHHNHYYHHHRYHLLSGINNKETSL